MVSCISMLRKVATGFSPSKAPVQRVISHILRRRGPSPRYFGEWKPMSSASLHASNSSSRTARTSIVIPKTYLAPRTARDGIKSAKIHSARALTEIPTAASATMAKAKGSETADPSAPMSGPAIRLPA